MKDPFNQSSKIQINKGYCRVKFTKHLDTISLDTVSRNGESLRVKMKSTAEYPFRNQLRPLCNYGYMDEIMGGHKRSDYLLHYLRLLSSLPTNKATGNETHYDTKTSSGECSDGWTACCFPNSFLTMASPCRLSPMDVLPFGSDHHLRRTSHLRPFLLLTVSTVGASL